MTDRHYIHTNKYRLEIQESWENRKIQMVLMSKIDNSKPMCLTGTVPAEWMEENDEDKMRRRLRRYRELYVKLSIPPTIRLLRTQEVSLLLKDEAQHGASNRIYSQREGKKGDIKINRGVKYWKEVGKVEKKVVLDPHNSCVHLSLLEREPVKAVEALIPAVSLPEQEQSLPTLFKALQKLELSFSSHRLIVGKKLLSSVPVQAATPTEEDVWEKRPGKIALFRHIFLTELITHMITRQFGREKWKDTRHREGYSQKEYLDEDLEVLRSWGYRMNQFRDHPIKWKKKKRKEEEELDSLDEEEEEEAERSDSEEK